MQVRVLLRVIGELMLSSLFSFLSPKKKKGISDPKEKPDSQGYWIYRKNGCLYFKVYQVFKVDDTFTACMTGSQELIDIGKFHEGRWHKLEFEGIF
jgi:hypothetical protein